MKHYKVIIDEEECIGKKVDENEKNNLVLYEFDSLQGFNGNTIDEIKKAFPSFKGNILKKYLIYDKINDELLIEHLY